MQQEIEAVLCDIASHPWPTDIVEARTLYDKMGPPIAPDITTRPIEVGSVPGQILTPPCVHPGRCVLFLHGGGYTYGSLFSHGGMAAEIARAAASETLQLDYRLAPEHPFPAALEDACAAYKWILGRGIDPKGVVLVGDSAGGGLVVATLVALKEAGQPMPGAAVCISPWVDLEATGESYRTRQALDPMIDRELATFLAGIYLHGADPKMPTASPIHADLHELPPLLIQVGEREVLYSEAETLAQRARDAGVDVTFEEWPGMIHVWHLYYPILSAGRNAITRIGDFVRAKSTK
ncbi:alpha/beta hydrolase [bacterium]|nr:alpha/beta hydrolase [bacterium]